MSSRQLMTALLATLAVLAGCGDSGPTGASAPGDFVLDLLGEWSYEADFRVARPTVPTDSLDCTVRDARLMVAKPITPTTYTTSSGSHYTSYPHVLTSVFAGGTLRCQGQLSPAWEVSLVGVQPEVSRAIVAVDIDFVVTTPAGPMGVLSGACDCYADAFESIEEGRIRGHAGATLDRQFPQFTQGREGAMAADKVRADS